MGPVDLRNVRFQRCVTAQKIEEFGCQALDIVNSIESAAAGFVTPRQEPEWRSACSEWTVGWATKQFDSCHEQEDFVSSQTSPRAQRVPFPANGAGSRTSTYFPTSRISGVTPTLTPLCAHGVRRDNFKFSFLDPSCVTSGQF
jgi:hypothetical protein